MVKNLKTGLLALVAQNYHRKLLVAFIYMSNNMAEFLDGLNFFSGDELCSDSFPMIEKENFFYEITGKVKIILLH